MARKTKKGIIAKLKAKLKAKAKAEAEAIPEETAAEAHARFGPMISAPKLPVSAVQEPKMVPVENETLPDLPVVEDRTLTHEGKATQQTPIPTTEPTVAMGPLPSERISPPEADIAHPGEGVEAEKARKPLEPPEVIAEKENAAFPIALMERAKKIGFTDEQIASYGNDSTLLEAACNRIKPQVTPPPETKRQIFRPFKEKPKGKPARAICISEISVLRAAHVIRAGYDQSNLEMFCRQHKPKILPDSIQKVTVIRDYVPNKRDILMSTIIIEYLKER